MLCFNWTVNKLVSRSQFSPDTAQHFTNGSDIHNKSMHAHAHMHTCIGPHKNMHTIKHIRTHISIEHADTNMFEHIYTVTHTHKKKNNHKYLYKLTHATTYMHIQTHTNTHTYAHM